MTPSPTLTSKIFAKKAALPTRSKTSSWCCPSNIEISPDVQHLSPAAAPNTSLSIILPSSLPKALPCFPPIFTRRTNGHCRDTLRAVNVFISLRNNNKCNAFHSFPLFPSSSFPVRGHWISLSGKGEVSVNTQHRMSGALPPLLLSALWYGQGGLYLFYLSYILVKCHVIVLLHT